MAQKKMKRLILGFGVVVLLGGVLLVVRQKSAEYEEALNPAASMIIDLTADEIKSVSYTPESGVTTTFVREEGLWTSPTHPDADLDQTKVGVLAASVTGCKITHVIEDVADLAPYGLAEPLISLSVTSMDGVTTDVLIGEVNDTTMDVYCCRDGDMTTVYSVSTGLITDLEQTIGDYLKSED